MPLRFLLTLLAGFCLSNLACSKSENASKLQIATAASLAGAFEKVGEAFKAESGIEISLVVSSSGKLSQQIKEGAPYDLFASANAKYMDDLAASNEVQAQSAVSFAVGRLVLWTKSGEPPKLLDELKDAKYEHIAIANPEHAPYGTAAKEALQSQGLWDSMKDKMVRASNVRQAMQFAESGNAEVGLLALSLAIQSKGNYQLVPSEHHKALVKKIAIVSDSAKKKQAQAFIDFLSSPKGQAIIAPFGLEAAN